MIDLVVVLLLAGGFLLGFFRGSVRQLLSVAAWLVAFLVAANASQLTARLFLEGYGFSYATMLGFGAVFVVLTLGGVLFFQLSGQTTALTRHELLDDFIGGLLGIALVLLVTASVLVILDVVYALPQPPTGNQLALLAQIHSDSQSSIISRGLRDTLIPLLGIVLRPLLPAHVVAVMT